MKLIVAKSSGFCFGVERAMKMALEAAKKSSRNLYTLGPLIHNPQAVNYLEEFGIKSKERVEDIPRGIVILRSHGISLTDLEKIKKRRLKVVDATCPIVKKANYYAKFLDRNGYRLVIVGDPEHPEVKAIRSYIRQKVRVVESPEALMEMKPCPKIGIIAQTTQNFNLFKEVVKVILEKGKEVRVFNTICHATMMRQREAIELARTVDCMIVIGGHNSGNTQRLVHICKEVQPRTYQIETAQELNPKWFNRVKKAGLTSGASTPPWIIHEVEKEINRLVTHRLKYL
ncbi:MAG: 4-hydroxy-3-methylbut-2-enyl diphosphate reductase [Thermodesulfobacteriota bacterium]